MTCREELSLKWKGVQSSPHLVYLIARDRDELAPFISALVDRTNGFYAPKDGDAFDPDLDKSVVAFMVGSYHRRWDITSLFRILRSHPSSEVVMVPGSMLWQ